MALHAPHLFINKYMQDKIAELSNEGMPFFPTLPTDLNGTLGEIDIITEGSGTMPSGQSMAVYDRMFKLRRQAFPHLKYEQLLYYFYSYGVDDLFRLQQQSQDLLDRGDESACEINAWIKSLWESKGSLIEEGTEKPVLYFEGTTVDLDLQGGIDGQNIVKTGEGFFYLPFFHEIKVFQLEESRDIVDFGTARTWAGNKLIVDYCWHA